MARPSLIRLGWALRRVHGRLGWTVLLALALAASAFGLWRASAAFEARGLEVRSRIEAARSRPAAEQPEDPQPRTERRLEELYASLPDARDIPGVVRRLFAAAEAQGVGLARGDYRATTDDAAGIIKYQLVFPVQGKSGRINDFILQALQDERALTLEKVSFRRETTADTRADARIHFLLLVRP